MTRTGRLALWMSLNAVSPEMSFSSRFALRGVNAIISASLPLAASRIPSTISVWNAIAVSTVPASWDNSWEHLSKIWEARSFRNSTGAGSIPPPAFSITWMMITSDCVERNGRTARQVVTASSSLARGMAIVSKGECIYLEVFGRSFRSWFMIRGVNLKDRTASYVGRRVGL